VRSNRHRLCVVFEGRDAAGKGGVIKRITDPLNPRVCRVVALATPTEKERGQWYFQRYVAELPSAGEIVLFDRSWYNRAGVERVMGSCTEDEYRQFMRSCPLFEEMLVRSGIILVKYWFSVNDEEQEVRFQDRMRNPIKRWKLSTMDIASRKHPLHRERPGAIVVVRKGLHNQLSNTFRPAQRSPERRYPAPLAVCGLMTNSNLVVPASSIGDTVKPT